VIVYTIIKISHYLSLGYIDNVQWTLKGKHAEKTERSKFTLNYSNYDLSGGDLTVFTELKANTYFGEKTPPPPSSPCVATTALIDVHTVSTVVGGTYW
jgi:hypothetical protein